MRAREKGEGDVKSSQDGQVKTAAGTYPVPGTDQGRVPIEHRTYHQGSQSHPLNRICTDVRAIFTPEDCLTGFSEVTPLDPTNRPCEYSAMSNCVSASRYPGFNGDLLTSQKHHALLRIWLDHVSTASQASVAVRTGRTTTPETIQIHFLGEKANQNRHCIVETDAGFTHSPDSDRMTVDPVAPRHIGRPRQELSI